MVISKRLPTTKFPASQGLNKTRGAVKGLNSLILLIILGSVIAAMSSTISWHNNPVSRLSGTGERPSTQTTSSCDLSSGRWVFDNQSYPLYPERRCSFMSDQLACEKYGRKDLNYQKWRWQPDGCKLPRFNGTRLLERIRGKRMVFVGDSLNRGQWISMLCLLENSGGLAKTPMKFDGSLTTVKFKEYNTSVDFYWSPLLVESNSDDPINHRLPERIVRLDAIEKHGQHWIDADILVFNTYLWWRRDPTMKVLWGAFDSENQVYEDIEKLTSFKMALKTWADWLQEHVDPIKTHVFFVSLSPTHQRADEWDAHRQGNCHDEREPITKDGHWGVDSDASMMRAVEEAVNRLHDTMPRLRINLLNVTQLSEYRKDGHPSIYRKQWETLKPEQLANPTSYSDCIHWCLPGVPDVWNEFLYANLFLSHL